MKSVLIAAIVAVACSGAAMAADQLKGKAMSDSEMDGVTAGLGGGADNGASDYGLYTAGGAIAGPGYSGDSHPGGNRHN